MAHDGIDSVPKTGTWLLEKGERVVTSKTSAKLDATLARLDKGGNSGSNQVTITVNVNNGEAESDIQTQQSQGKQLAEQLDAAVQAVLVRESRPGGMLGVDN